MKICIKCNIEKEFTEFYKRKDNQDGYRNDCKECHKIANKPGSIKFRKKPSSIAKQKAYNKEYWNQNKETLIEENKERYYNNREEYLEQKKEYYINNKSNIIIKIHKHRMYKLKTDSLYKLKHDIRCLIRKSLTLKGYKKKSKTQELLVCSFEEFKKHLESMFENWMSWDNHGIYNGKLSFGWDIDHIIPLHTAKTEEDIIKLNHYTNLQPLCSYINRVIKNHNLA